MRVARYPMIDRGDADSALRVLDEVSQALKAGVSVLSFPEGTRSITGELGRFKIQKQEAVGRGVRRIRAVVE